MSNDIDKNLFEQIFGHKLIILAYKLRNKQTKRKLNNR